MVHYPLWFVLERANAFAWSFRELVASPRRVAGVLHLSNVCSTSPMCWTVIGEGSWYRGGGGVCSEPARISHNRRRALGVRPIDCAQRVPGADRLCRLRASFPNQSECQANERDEEPR